jgi:hypothetical protein
MKSVCGLQVGYPSLADVQPTPRRLASGEGEEGEAAVTEERPSELERMGV